MSKRILSVSFALFVCAGWAGAQNVILSEDFEGGLPPTWWSAGSAPQYWHVAAPGECGSVTNMMAYNNGPSGCSYPTYSFATVGSLATPFMLFNNDAPLEVSFDYKLGIDVGDQVSVIVVSESDAWDPYEIATEADLIQDGALHSATARASSAHPALGESFRIEFLFNSDTTGNTGLGWMLDNVQVTDYVTGVPFCFGDGSGTACPCGNVGGAGEGCRNSTGQGARLDGEGSSSLSAGEIVLRASQLPPGRPGLLFQGTAALNGGNGLIFGDGLRCVGGNIKRFGVRTADAGGGAAWGPGLAAAGGWTAGDTRHFQVWYRDPVGSPCLLNFNLTHATSVTFAP